MISVTVIGGFTQNFRTWERALEYMQHCSTIMKKVRFRVSYDGNALAEDAEA